MTDQRKFLDIPYDEHIVPFPNSAAVLMQHAREFPDKTAFEFTNISYTYSQLLDICRQRTLPVKKGNGTEPQNTEEFLLFIMILLFRGIPFELDLDDHVPHLLKWPEDLPLFTNKMDIPFVKLDDPAMTLNKKYLFSQYNLLVAAQALGRALKLFRPGHAVCPSSLTTVTDLVFGVLAPFYFAKTIHFDTVDPAEEVLSGIAQYAWCRNILPKNNMNSDNLLLRDASLVFTCEFPDDLPLHAYRLIRSFDRAAGLGPLTDKDGDLLPLPGTEIIRKGDKWEIRGHVLAQTVCGN